MKHDLETEPKPGRLPGGVADPVETLSLEQVAQLSGVDTADLRALVEGGVLASVMPDIVPLTFRIGCVLSLQRANELRQELGLDVDGFALAMRVLGRITELEARFRATPPGLHKPRAESRLAGHAS